MTTDSHDLNPPSRSPILWSPGPCADAAGWTITTLNLHFEAMRRADERYEQERDRRYAEVKAAEEKALRVKEQADTAALGLAREIQTYKDEQANRLREQINSERGLYATKPDLIAAVRELNATIKPLADYISAERGRDTGSSGNWRGIERVITLLIAVIAVAWAIFKP